MNDLRRNFTSLRFFRVFILALLLCAFQSAFTQVDSTQNQNPLTQESSSTTPLPAPVSNIVLVDTPNDDGHSITVSWDLSADDVPGSDRVMYYEIYRGGSRDEQDSTWVLRGTALKGVQQYEDRGGRDPKKMDRFFPKDKDFYYKVVVASFDAKSVASIAGPIRAEDDWFNRTRIPTLVFTIIFFVLTLYFINIAKKGIHLYVRPLAGIEAIDEAIGRATEMGRPILYVLGLGTASDIATIASFTILGRVARRVAEYQTSMIVPCYDPIVMTVAQETVKTGYADAARQDSYVEDSVYFVTQSQFAYVAAVNGTMLRERPATNLYLGKFYAESLLLAETGVLAGSIQISGTDEIAQLPFFVVACDYTLIGEELYAASAYLGREPLLLGTLKAQDWFKGLVIIAILAGLLTRVLGQADIIHSFFKIS
ncbi:MAG: fibronectin type III domain-containing protein [bacterium]|nr:fibronectin type III domain-containing protein [bacterium]